MSLLYALLAPVEVSRSLRLFSSLGISHRLYLPIALEWSVCLDFRLDGSEGYDDYKNYGMGWIASKIQIIRLFLDL